MLIRVGYDMAFHFPAPTAMVLMLSLHPSCASTIRKPERLEVQPDVAVSEFIDAFGNRCSRVFAPAGRVVLRNDAIVADQRHSWVDNSTLLTRATMSLALAASDTALTTTFGVNHLASFTIWTDEVSEKVLRQPRSSPQDSVIYC